MFSTDVNHDKEEVLKKKLKNPTVVAERALSISPGALDTRLLLYYYGGLVLLIYAPAFSSCLVMNSLSPQGCICFYFVM